MKNKLIIGLTGPSGSGKTQITKILQNQNLFIIDADSISHDLLKNNNSLQKKIINSFSPSIICDKNGAINRRLLSKIVFSDKKKLFFLNSIIFPYIFSEITDQISKSSKNIIILDAPTLIESNLYKICHKIIVVLADHKIRLNRIILRDKISLDIAKNRLFSQLNTSEYLKFADYIIYNNNDLSQLNPQISKIFKSIFNERNFIN